MTKATGKPAKPKAPPADDFDDLIGGAPEPEPEERVSLNLAETYGGVSAHWLAQMFGADKNTIKKKLAKANVPIAGYRGQNPLYLLVEAAPYLIKPKVDIVAYITSLRPNDLPPVLSDAFWSAMLKKQKWQENAGDLWRTADVLEVLGDLNLMIRSRVNLWAEDVDRAEGITDAQRKEINRLSDELLQSIHKALVELPSKRKTSSSLAEEDDVPEESPPSVMEAAE